MNTDKPITDNDLVLLYYGEHDDPQLAARVARSPELSRRFERLGAGLALTEHYRAPEPAPDYGSRTWAAISSRLQASDTPRRARWWTALAAPRLSLAGAFGIAAVAVLAFVLGRNAAEQPGGALPLPVSPGAVAAASLDPARLLTSSVAGHLDDVDLVLTQFANNSEPAANEAEWATDMLVANRLYRQAASTRGDQRLARFLGELEPLLIELAYQAQNATPTSRARMQQEVRDGLLFRVRVMNQQLKQPGTRA
jgi:hypothetical protein